MPQKQEIDLGIEEVSSEIRKRHASADLGGKKSVGVMDDAGIWASVLED